MIKLLMLSVKSFGTLNMLAFWDHPETRDHHREAKEKLTEELNGAIVGEQGSSGEAGSQKGRKFSFSSLMPQAKYLCIFHRGADFGEGLG